MPCSEIHDFDNWVRSIYTINKIVNLIDYRFENSLWWIATAADPGFGKQQRWSAVYPYLGAFLVKEISSTNFAKPLVSSGSPAELSVFYNLEKDIFVRKDVLMYAVQTSQAHPASNLLILYTK